MDESKAKAIAQKEVGNQYSVSLYRTTPRAYMFKCDAEDLIPSVLIVAVNKDTGNTGSSMTNPTEALNLCLKE